MSSEKPRSFPELSESEQASAREFMTSFFQALRTARMHDPRNDAYITALDRLLHHAETLFQQTQGFQVQFVENTLFVNHTQLRFEGGGYAAMRSLHQILDAQALGGFRIDQEPSLELLERLVQALSKNDEAHQLAEIDVALLGVQRFGDGENTKIDRNVFAVHAYAKLLLGVQKRLAELRGEDPGRGRVRVVRVIQDLVDLCGDRSALLLKLSSNTGGAPAEELCAANTCLLAVTLGHRLGVPRTELCDLGVVALLHRLTASLKSQTEPGERRARLYEWVLEDLGPTDSLFTRSLLVQDLSKRETNQLHPLSQLLRVASYYAGLVTGRMSKNGEPIGPSTALRRMQAMPPEALDPRYLDLLVNSLRAFPVDCHVLLKSGRMGVVAQTRARLDRPLVQLHTNPPEFCDLEVERREEIVSCLPMYELEQAEANLAEPVLPRSIRVEIDKPEVSKILRDRTNTRVRIVSGQPAKDLDPVEPRVVPSLGLDAEPSSSLPIEPIPRANTPQVLRGKPRSLRRKAAISGDLVLPENPHDRLIGQVFAEKYLILDKIGQGGMGTVFLAQQQPIEREVAIKVLLPNLVSDESAIKRFSQEARTISKVIHPRIVTIYDFGRTQQGELFLVMEYLRGHTVASLLHRGGPLTAGRATRIIWQTCQALEAAHAAGVIHRDLKPDNLFLTHVSDDPEFVKVLDFGLAKLADDQGEQRLTQAGKVFGTPRYMSPEQAEGRPLDFRSDIYTLGVVLFELLTARPLFTAETMVGLLVKHIHEPAPMPSQLRPDMHFDRNLERLVMRILSKNPDDRPQDVCQLANELEPFIRAPLESEVYPSTTEQPALSLPDLSASDLFAGLTQGDIKL